MRDMCIMKLARNDSYGGATVARARDASESQLAACRESVRGTNLERHQKARGLTMQ